MDQQQTQKFIKRNSITAFRRTKRLYGIFFISELLLALDELTPTLDDNDINLLV